VGRGKHKAEPQRQGAAR